MEISHIPKRSLPVRVFSICSESVVRPPAERFTLFASQFLKSLPQTYTGGRIEN